MASFPKTRVNGNAKKIQKVLEDISAGKKNANAAWGCLGNNNKQTNCVIYSNPIYTCVLHISSSGNQSSKTFFFKDILMVIFHDLADARHERGTYHYGPESRIYSIPIVCQKRAK